MTISYTTNFLLPKLDTGSSNWGSVANGAMDTIDREIKAAQKPLVSLLNKQVLISRLHGGIVLQHFQI